jgi:hypothetical protein
VTSMVVRILCPFQLEKLSLHLVLWCPLFFLGGSKAHAFRSLLGSPVLDLSNFLCWNSRCWPFLRSCFTYCRFSLAGLLSRGEQWPRVSFSVSFSSSQPHRPVKILVWVSVFLSLLPSLIYRSQSLPGPSALALVLSVHPGSLCKDSGHDFNFLRRLASPLAGLGRYLPQVCRALADLFSPSIFAAPSIGSPAAGLFRLRFQSNWLLLVCLFPQVFLR